MIILLAFVALGAAALLLLLVLAVTAPEAVEDEDGFRVVGPSSWRRFRMRATLSPRHPKPPGFPPIHRGTHA